MVSVALLVGQIPFFIFPIICASAIIFNIFILPKLKKGVFLYQNEVSQGVSRGLITYPSILFVLSLIFIEQPLYFVIGWCVMAFGDGFASLFGSYSKILFIPWNKNKSWLGFLCFIIFGSNGTWLFLQLLPETVLNASAVSYAVIFTSVLVAGIFETIEGLYDDNIVVALSASGVSWLLVEIQPFQISISTENYFYFLIALIFSFGSVLSTSLDWKGGVVGFFIAFTAMLGFSYEGFVMLALFVVPASLATKLMGKHQPKNLKQSTRSYANALSNGAVPLFLAIITCLNYELKPILFILYSCALASAFSDTISSEFGTAIGRRYIKINNFKKAQKGEDGAISMEGILSGLVAAGIFGTTHYFIAERNTQICIIIMFCGFLGNLFDSLLGATIQKNNHMNNHTVNFANTVFASVLASLLI